MSHSLGIDVMADDQSRLIVELAEQPEIIEIMDGGIYHEDVNYSKIKVETTWSESELDDWLYNNTSAEWIGVFER